MISNEAVDVELLAAKFISTMQVRAYNYRAC